MVDGRWTMDDGRWSMVDGRRTTGIIAVHRVHHGAIPSASDERASEWIASHCDRSFAPQTMGLPGRREHRILAVPNQGGEMDGESSFGLVELAKTGDANALERLVQRYLPRLRRWTRGRLPPWARDAADTDDLVQETLLSAIRNLPQFTMREQHSLRAYMKCAARNRVHDEIKRAVRNPPPVPIPLSAACDKQGADEDLIRRDALFRCRLALLRLTPADRRLIELAFSTNCTATKLAELTGKPSGDAARVALSRAVRRLSRGMQRLA